VEDCAEAVVLATEQYDGAEPVNIGAGFEICIGDLAKEIARLTGYQERIVGDSSKPNGQPRRCLDVSRAQAAFGFNARTTFRAGLAQTVAWYESDRGIHDHRAVEPAR
jgi:GDP-L-fucose synthase